MADLIAIESVAQRILLLRGQKVMVDADLAELYGVDTKRLNEQVKRNAERFPADFMFQLTVDEKAEVVANCDHLSKLKYSRTLPYAFTEHGALMLGNVLRSARAVEVSAQFSKCRHSGAGRNPANINSPRSGQNQGVVPLAWGLINLLDSGLTAGQFILSPPKGRNDVRDWIAGLMNGIRELMKQPNGESRPIGFTAKIQGSKA